MRTLTCTRPEDLQYGKILQVMDGVLLAFWAYRAYGPIQEHRRALVTLSSVADLLGIHTLSFQPHLQQHSHVLTFASTRS